jgi:hypothetical protein
MSVEFLKRVFKLKKFNHIKLRHIKRKSTRMMRNARVKKISNIDELIFEQLEETMNEKNMNDENDEINDNAVFDVDVD